MTSSNPATVARRATQHPPQLLLLGCAAYLLASVAAEFESIWGNTALSAGLLLSLYCALILGVRWLRHRVSLGRAFLILIASAIVLFAVTSRSSDWADAHWAASHRLPNAR